MPLGLQVEAVTGEEADEQPTDERADDAGANASGQLMLGVALDEQLGAGAGDHAEQDDSDDEHGRSVVARRHRPSEVGAHRDERAPTPPAGRWRSRPAPRRPAGAPPVSGSASLVKIALTCFSTVEDDRCSACSMPAFVRPSAISRSTSSSRGVRAASGLAVAAAAPAHERVDDLRVDDRAARAHLAQGVDEVLEVADAVLEQVAEPGRPVGEQRERVALVGVLRQHDDADLRVARPGWRGRPRCPPCGGRRHPDVGEHGIGAEPAHGVEQLGGRCPTPASTSTRPESSSRRRTPSRTR